MSTTHLAPARPPRPQPESTPTPAPRDLPVAAALREVLREGYGGPQLRADLMSGAVVGVVALPLSMALAIASGVPPQQGLYTAIVGGFVIAALGGSRVQVSGPTAAFVVILAPIAGTYGPGGLMVATLMAGVFLAGMGLARLGRLIQFIPNPVTTGFTSGIAVVIATLQVKDFLGLRVEGSSEHFLERAVALADALPTTRWSDAAVGVFTLAVLLLWPRITRRVPAPLAALTLAALGAAVIEALWPGSGAATIADRFSYETESGSAPGIPRTPPLPDLPWNMPGPAGRGCRWAGTPWRPWRVPPSPSPCWAPSSRCCRRWWPTP